MSEVQALCLIIVASLIQIPLWRIADCLAEMVQIFKLEVTK